MPEMGNADMAMNGRLAGKVAIVTGAGSSGPGVGTGKAISVLLAREGASVLLVDNVPERAEETLRLVKAESGEGEIFTGDVSRWADCEAMVQAAVERFGGLDILVNNAAVTHHVSIVDTTPELYEHIVGVNLTGPFMACKFAVPALIARGGGSIVNIGSIASVRDSGSTHPAYSATKAALLGLTTDLAGAYGRQNLRVNAVLPGIIATPMAQSVTTQTGSGGAMGANLLARRGDAWDIAEAVLWLCSDGAAYITGVVLPVDGGAVAAMPASYILRFGARDGEHL
ncbi:MAG: SDR family oxidoreductase [Acidimicrobiaceae bacterium]|nr:SDR family oxidoreductase [Acidimicrobiaceae bacterium]